MFINTTGNLSFSDILKWDWRTEKHQAITEYENLEEVSELTEIEHLSPPSQTRTARTRKSPFRAAPRTQYILNALPQDCGHRVVGLTTDNECE